MIRFYTVAILVLGIINSFFAQRGKHGAVVFSTPSSTVNEYTALTANAVAGTNIISVANSNLNANGRFAGNLQVGDLVMIIQVQGINMKTFAAPPGQDSTYGEILSYQNCGNYEFAQVFAIPNGTSIQLDCGLKNSYTTVNSKTQVVRVPRYSALTVNAGSILTGDPWNGTIGGILSVEVNGASVINGSVVATGLGFRGGLASNNGTFGGLRFVDNGGGVNEGGEKGESIAGSAADYIAFYGGAFAKGSPANGGGGGNSHNCAGGGGSNAGSLANWSGYGVCNPAYAVAFNLEFPGRAAIVSPGGGKGGYGFSGNNLNPNTNGPGNTAWGGANRPRHGGHGGRCLDYTTGRIFFGGGGGAGHVNNIVTNGNTGGHGGRGGGLIYMLTYGTVSGAGFIISNGNNGTSTSNGSGFTLGGDDSGGGGGGGGTIFISTSANVTGVTLRANGGQGGNVVMGGGFGGTSTAFGPGGGGGGGYIAITSGAPLQTVNGGNSGTMSGLGSAQIIANFPVNGATNGNSGLSNQVVPNYTIGASNVTVCVNNAATLNAISNDPTASFFWYNNIVGPTQLGTGAAFTTTVFTTPGTYTVFASMCPGVYRIPVLITVTNGPTLTVANSTICSGQTATISASGATNYTWSTGATSSSISVSPAANTVYTVTGGISGCTSTITASVTVNSSGNINVFGSTICAGQTATVSAAAALGYTWSTGALTQSITVNPVVTSSYVVNAAIAGCVVTNTAVVVVNPSPTLSVNNSTICNSQTATLTANGAGSYVWYDGSTVSTITVSPNTTSVYSFTGTSSGCSSVSNAAVTVNSNPTITIVGTPSVCTGQAATFTASGATSYTWNGVTPGNTLLEVPVTNTVYNVQGVTNGCSSSASIAVSVGTVLTVSVNSATLCPPGQAILTPVTTGTNFVWSNGATTNFINVTPISTTVYTVTANFGGCVGSATAEVLVIPSPSVNFSAGVICAGQSETLTVVGATSYTWNTGSNSSSIVVTPTVTTLYSVFATNGPNCAQSTTVPVVVNNPPIINLANANICAGGSTVITASGATSYTWIGSGSTSNSIAVSPLANTSYTVIGANGSCTSQAVSNVSVTSGGSFNMNSPTICEGQQVTIGTNFAGVGYLWNTGATTPSITVNLNTNATYTLQVVTAAGCTVVANNTVFVSPAPVLTLQASSLNICKGNTLAISAIGSSNYTWQPGGLSGNNVIVSPTLSTVFYATTSINNGCISTASIPIVVDNTPTITTNLNPQVCPNTPLTIYGSGANSFEWTYDGNYYIGNPLTFVPTKSVTVNIKAYSGACSTFTNIQVNVSSLNAGLAAESNYVEYPGSLTFTNTSIGYNNIYWDLSNGQTFNNTNIVSGMFETPGKYLVALIASDSYGCRDTLYYPVESGCSNPDLFIPNAFTPNADGVNDEFKIIGGLCVESFQCLIFDRWGILLKTMDGSEDSWDAKFKGTLVEQGIYTYKITSKLINGKHITRTGHVTVLR
jgi:gliding motility-associated-like protein